MYVAPASFQGQREVEHHRLRVLAEVATGAFAPLASAVVVAGYRGTLQGLSGPLRWLRERRLRVLLARRGLLRLPELPGLPEMPGGVCWAWAGSARGQPGARSVLVVGSMGGSGAAGVASAGALSAAWGARAWMATGVFWAGEDGWGSLPKCRSHLKLWPRTD
jgi:hypothetical protein